MPSSAYYRRQADICLGMALAARDEKATEEFRALALAFLAKAADAEADESSADILQEHNDGQIQSGSRIGFSNI